MGKTDIAMELAGHLPSEIVSCDSMQVYKEISIASSKPSAAELKKIPHHLIDVISVEEKFDVSVFNKLARKAIEGILAKNKNVLVVGGSGMYMQILLDGIFEESAKDLKLRDKLSERAKNEGPEKLHIELTQVDPSAAAKIHPNDAKRIIRALEVFHITQKPISQLQKTRAGLWGHYPIKIFCLDRSRDELYELINARVENMLKSGLEKEIKALKDRPLSLTSQSIIGVRELQTYLRGEIDLALAKELMKMNTRRLAKRQLTWFRKDKRLHWINLTGRNKTAIIKEILKELESHE